MSEMITKQQAIYVAYLLVEALNTEEMKPLLLRAYGLRGIVDALIGCEELAKEHDFEMPIVIADKKRA